MRNDLAIFLTGMALCMCTEARIKPNKELQKLPAEALDHAGIIQSLNHEAFESGQRIYSGLCLYCHVDDGKTDPLPTARDF
ncbi:MAG: hypothetical protein AAF492_10810 [Verrucomicrobiota bacterium]